MNLAQILSPWAGSGTQDDPFFPLAAQRYLLLSWRDASGGLTPADPNLVIIEATLTDTDLAACENDPDLYVLWSEPA
jgi:hypothetical protein